jgi:hypothetical protein
VVEPKKLITFFCFDTKNRSGGPPKNQGCIHFLMPLEYQNWEIKNSLRSDSFYF